jgi:hypothetical protein
MYIIRMPRLKRSELYVTERNDIIDRIVDILDVDSNNSFTLYELDGDIDKQEHIIGLLGEVRKYFNFGNIHPEKAKRPYLMVIRNVLKFKYRLYSKEKKDDTIVKGRYFMKYFLEPI